MTTDASRPIAGRREFSDAVRDALLQACERRVAAMWWVDPDFADWPLGEPALVQALTAWAQRDVQLVLLAASFRAIEQRHPRFVTWRQLFGHRIDARTPSPGERCELPTLLRTVDGGVLRLLDPLHHRGYWRSGDAHEASAAADEIDALLQRSEPGFPASTLGL